MKNELPPASVCGNSFEVEGNSESENLFCSIAYVRYAESFSVFVFFTI
jgi:hypothetical protein